MLVVISVAKIHNNSETAKKNAVFFACRCRGLPFSENLLYFLVGFRELILAQLYELLRALELRGHLVDVQLVVLHSANYGLQFGEGLFVVDGLFHRRTLFD